MSVRNRLVARGAGGPEPSGGLMKASGVAPEASSRSCCAGIR